MRLSCEHLSFAHKVDHALRDSLPCSASALTASPASSSALSATPAASAFSKPAVGPHVLPYGPRGTHRACVLALPSPPAILALCPSSSKSGGFRAEPPAQHGHHPEGAERLAPRPTGPHHGKELAADARRAVQVAHAQMVLRVDGAEREQQSALIVEGLLQLVRTWA